MSPRAPGADGEPRAAGTGAAPYLTIPVLAAAWAFATGLLEGRILELWYAVALHRAANYVELGLNYAILGAGAALAALVVLGLLRRVRPVAPGISVEFLIGIGLLALVLLSFVSHTAAAGLGVPVPVVPAVAVVLGVVAGWWFGRVRPAIRLATRLAFVLAVVLAFAAPGASTAVTPMPAAGGARPNVLLVLVDTLRPDFLSCYGYDQNTSPRLDELAARGARFEHVTAQASWTLPSTASVHTGLYPSSHGAIRYGAGIADAPVRLAEVMHAAGYHTAAFTENWYITPRNGFGRGFESFWGYWFPWVHESTVLHRVFVRAGYPLLELTRKKDFPENPTEPGQLNWDARVTVDKALSWLDGDDERPFFLYLHLMGPHGPYGPPEYLLAGPPPAVRLTDHPKPMGGALPLGEAGAPPDPGMLDLIHQLYAADIRYVDHHLGRILDRLRTEQRLENTVVVFTSDHGEEFYEHSGWNHGASAYEEVVHVPLVISWPAEFPDPRTIPDRVRSIDILPTIADLAAAETPPHLPGRSLRGLLAGTESPPPDPAVVEACALRPAGTSINAATQGSHKLIQLQVGDRERRLLFDLDTDPGESIDLFTAQPVMADSLLRLLGAGKAAAAALAAPGTDVRMDPATRRLLESLGYVN